DRAAGFSVEAPAPARVSSISSPPLPKGPPMRLARLSAGVALLAALALGSSGGLPGQDKKDRKGPEPEKKAVPGPLPKGWEKLDLTDAQRAEILRLNAEYKAKTDPLQEELRRLWTELARKRVGLLTDGQKKKLGEVVTAGP